MKWSRTAKNVSRLRRDFRKLLTDDLRRFDHGHALLDAFLDGAGLEPAVRVRPELFRPDVAQTLGHDAHGLDRDLDLLGPCVDRGLVDLDVLGTGTLEVTGLVADDLRESEHRVAPRRIGLVVRPVEEGVWTGEHSLHRL